MTGCGSDVLFTPELVVSAAVAQQNVRAMTARFPFRAFLGAAVSSTSLAAFAYLNWPSHYPRIIIHKIGPDLDDFAGIAWFLGPIVGALFVVWAWRTEPKLPARVAGSLALAALLSLLCAVAFLR